MFPENDSDITCNMEKLERWKLKQDAKNVNDILKYS